MHRTARLFALLAVLIAATACSNPAAPAAEPDAAASLDGGTTLEPGCYEVRQNGSGSIVIVCP